jgi:hypothetical protein
MVLLLKEIDYLVVPPTIGGMSFTALHRASGFGPGPLTDEILDAAVAMGAMESHDLDWKSELPPANGLAQTDFPKDVAAMANSGGGVIIYGVREVQKAATERIDVGALTEQYERTLRSAALTAISPPVFGLIVHRLGAEGNRAVVIEVSASIDGPHLIYRNELFGAPVRNNADTAWMKERQIEVMYRARFNGRRNAIEELDALFSDASAGRDTDKRAWLIAVAHPRLPRFQERLSPERIRAAVSKTGELALTYAGRGGVHPLENVDLYNPRSGLRRWVLPNTAGSERTDWGESWASIHDNGSVTLATAIGAHPMRDGEFLKGWQVDSTSVECTVADFMALIRSTAEMTDNDEYDLRVGIEWFGAEPLRLLLRDRFNGIYGDSSTPIHRFTPVESSLNAAEPDLDFYWHVHDLALDCVNQGGLGYLQLIGPPKRPSNET